MRATPARLALLPTLVLLAQLVSPPSRAEAPKPDAAIQQVLRKAQGALRQLSEEKAKLEADYANLQTEKAALASKMEAQAGQINALQDEVERQKTAAEAMKNANTGLESQLNGGRVREEQLRGKLRDIIDEAKKIQGDNQLLVASVQEREQWISQCQQKNSHIAQAYEELIRRYQDKGFWDVMKNAEPLTGIGKVQTENAVQDYRFKLQDLKANPFESQVKEAPSRQDEGAQAMPTEDGDGE